MTEFALAVAAVAAVGLGLALRPLWSRRRASPSPRELNIAVHRDELRELDADLQAGTLAQADYDRAREELETRLLEDVGEDVPGRRPRTARPLPEKLARWGTVSAAAAVPLVALAVYLAVGDVRGLDPQARVQRDIGMAEIEAMVERLAQRLEENPDDVEGWRMLGRSYGVMGRFAEAARAYSRAAAKSPRDAGLLADLADALAMARGRNLQGEPEELVLRALQLDSQNLKALALAGTAAFNRDDFKAAVRYWERMLPHLPAGSEEARMVQSNVDEAKARAAEPASAKAKPAAGAALTGTVSLSPKLARKASPEDTVFLFARAADGPPMPLAALRLKVKDLPARFSLDDSMAMGPKAKLSAYPKVVVVARVSKGGTPAAQSGDLEGKSGTIASNARDVAVTIDSVVP